MTDEDAPAGQGDTDSGTDIELPDDTADHPEYCIHPVLLDAALRQLAAAVPAESQDTSYLPVSVGTIRVFGSSQRRARCHADLAEQAPGDYRGSRSHRRRRDGDRGAPGIEVRPVDPSAVRLPLEQKIFDAVWVQSSAPQTGSADDRIPTGSWLLCRLRFRDSGTRGGILRPVELTDPARRQRRVVGRAGSRRGHRENRG